MKKIPLIFIILTLLFGCSLEDEDNAKIYTSFYGMYDFTRMIAGNDAEIEVLIPPGVEAHDWEPSARDIMGLNSADVFIYSGMDMEPWAGELIESLDNNELIAIEASNGVNKLSEGEGTDPHVWLDPENAMKQLESIAKGLSDAYPENAKLYADNLENCKKRLAELDKEFETAAEEFVDKEIIVTHGAFGYLCSAYGIKQYSIEGITGESDPSSATIREVIDYMKSNGKTSIFYVKAEGDKLANTIAQEVGAKTYTLNPFEGDGTGQGYFEVMQENLENIKEALGADE